MFTLHFLDSMIADRINNLGSPKSQMSFFLLREALKKSVPKSGKSLKGRGGSASEIKKSTIQNVDVLIRGGKVRFSGFSQM